MIYQTLPLNTPAIAVVPDHEIAPTVIYALREAGYTPDLVQNSQEAIRNLAAFQPYLVLLDLSSSDDW